jgi:hypothetical protein
MAGGVASRPRVRWPAWRRDRSAAPRGAAAGRLDPNADHMLRAASIAATEAVRDGLVPREIEQSYLRGVRSRRP